MLARIEKVEGVEWAGAEATGHHLAVRPSPSADPERVAAGVGAALGRRGRRAAEPLARSQLASLDRGDPWYTAATVHALSYLEGRLVAVHVAARVARELGLDGATKEELVEAVRETFFGVLERVHAEGGRESSGWFYLEWPGVARAVAGRLADAVPDRAALEAAIAGCYRR